MLPTCLVLDLLVHGLVLVLSKASRGSRDGSCPDAAGTRKRAKSKLRSHDCAAKTRHTSVVVTHAFKA